MKTIYNVYVPIESQEQADRMKQLCIDNSLPYWDYKEAFKLTTTENWFEFNEEDIEFFITSGNEKGITEFGKTQVTEQEFIELLKQKNNE